MFSAALDGGGFDHFYIFWSGLVRFYSLHDTGKFNVFDWSVLWANEVAWLADRRYSCISYDLSGAAGVRRQASWSIRRSTFRSGFVRNQFLALEYLKASTRCLFNLNRVHWAYLTIFLSRQAAVLWTTRARPPPHSGGQQLSGLRAAPILHNTVYVVLCSAYLSE